MIEETLRFIESEEVRNYLWEFLKTATAQWNPKLQEEISYYIQAHKNEANGIEWERIRQEYCDLLP